MAGSQVLHMQLYSFWKGILGIECNEIWKEGVVEMGKKQSDFAVNILVKSSDGRSFRILMAH